MKRLSAPRVCTLLHIRQFFSIVSNSRTILPPETLIVPYLASIVTHRTFGNAIGADEQRACRRVHGWSRLDLKQELLFAERGTGALTVFRIF